MVQLATQDRIDMDARTDPRLDITNWKERFRSGEMWRSTKKYNCRCCGSLSDLWVMCLGGGPVLGPRLVCPNRQRPIHEELREKQWKLEDKGHPKSYLEELEAEIVALKLFFKEDIRKTERRIAQAEELLRGEPASGKREGF